MIIRYFCGHFVYMMTLMMMMMRKQMLSNGSLSVSEVYMEDSGMYGCTAENSGGSQRAELHLHVTSTYQARFPFKRNRLRW